MLVVENDPANAWLTAALLAADGRTNVRIAHSAEEALAMISTAPIRALIVDLGLPGDEWPGAGGRVNTDGSTSHIVAIAVTGNDEAGIERDAMRRGCAGFMHKPIDGDRLLRLLSAGLAVQDPREPDPGLPRMDWRPEDKAAMYSALADRSPECATGRPAAHFDAHFNAAVEGGRGCSPRNGANVSYRPLEQGDRGEAIAVRGGGQGSGKSILAKLDARDRTHAAVIGVRNGIVEP